MTDEHSRLETTEDYFRNLIETLTPENAARTYGTDLSKSLYEPLNLKLQAAAAYLSFCSTERQEKILSEQRDILAEQRGILAEQRNRLTEQRDILTEQRDMLKSMNGQSKAMKSQTTWVLRFTVALFVAVIVQIILAAVLLSRS